MFFKYTKKQKTSSSPSALIGDPATSCIKATALDPRLRGDDDSS